jgi:hypothetical protein
VPYGPASKELNMPERNSLIHINILDPGYQALRAAIQAGLLNEKFSPLPINPESLFYLIPDKVLHRTLEPEQKLDLLLTGRCAFTSIIQLSLQEEGSLSLSFSKYPAAGTRLIEQTECSFTQNGIPLHSKLFRFDVNSPLWARYYGKDLSWKDPLHQQIAQLLPDKINGRYMDLAAKIKLLSDGVDLSPTISIRFHSQTGFLHRWEYKDGTENTRLVRQWECTFLEQEKTRASGLNRKGEKKKTLDQGKNMSA